MNAMSKIYGLTAMTAVLTAVAGCAAVTSTTGPSVATHTSPPPHLPGTLCAAPGSVDSLTITRMDEFPRNHVHFTFPPAVATSAQEARTVARAVCGLPRMPHGVFDCPMDGGISYRLDFGASAGPGTTERHFPTVTVDATGCQQVTGAGPPRWLATTPRFWTVLGAAIGVADPGAAFRGCTGRLGMACPMNATYNA
jgi:hypothetical protein